MNILILPNFKKKQCLSVSQQAVHMLQKGGAKVFAFPEAAERLDRSVHPIQKEQLDLGIDFAVVIGGDGSIIRAAKLLLSFEIPLIGINLGTLGFLADIQTDRLEDLLPLLNGKYEVQECTTLEVHIQNDVKDISFTAINDVVICKNALSGIIDFKISCSGVETARFPADGVVVSTAVGSTAYAMSAGGALIHPDVKAFSITPICAHSLFARPMIVPEAEVVRVQTNANEQQRRVFVIADGNESAQITSQDVVSVFRHPKRARFVKPCAQRYYTAINEKLMDRS